MEYVYAVMLLHNAGKEINEGSVENVLNAAGIKPESVRVKALVAALADINIDEALKAPIFAAATPPSEAAPVVDEEKEEAPKEEEKKEEEEDLQGLSALFG